MSKARFLSRRRVLRAAVIGSAGVATTAALAGCGETKTVTVTETVEVEKVVTKIVEKEKALGINEARTDAIVVEKEIVKTVEVKPVVSEVNMWFNQSAQMKNFENKVLKHFNGSQGLYKLNVLLVPNNELSTKMTAAIAGGTAPDVVRIGGYTVANAFIKAKALIPLTRDYRPDLASLDFAPGLNQSFSFDGEMYAWPVNTGTQCLYYNTELYEKAGINTVPTTFAGMIENAKKVQGLGGKHMGYEMGNEPKAGTFNITHGHRLGFGREANMVDKTGTKVQLTSDRMKEYFNWIKKDVVDSGISPIKIMNEPSNTKDFQTGMLGHFFAYPSRLQASIDAIGAAATGVIRLPAGPYSDETPGGNGGVLSIPVAAKNPDGGYAFTEFIGDNKENNGLWAAAFGQLPPRMSHRDSVVYSAYMDKTPQVQQFLKGLEKGRLSYYGPGDVPVATEYAKALEKVYFSAASVDDALNAAQKAAQPLLDKALEKNAPYGMALAPGEVAKLGEQKGGMGTKK